MAKCKGCDGEIQWAVNQHGRGVPLDPVAVVDGDQVVDGEQEDGRLIVHKVRKDEEPTPGAERYRTHFQTCPNAGDFRREDTR